jgi:hypothetical protein
LEDQPVLQQWRLLRKSQTACKGSNENDAKDVLPTELGDHESDQKITKNWFANNNARDFLMNLFGPQSPLRSPDRTVEEQGVSSRQSAQVPDNDFSTDGEWPRSDRFLTSIRASMQGDLLEREQRNWTMVQDERVNRQEFEEAVLAAGLADVTGSEIDDLFQGMDADHDGELRCA